MPAFTVTSERKDIYHVAKDYASHCGGKTRLDPTYLHEVLNCPPTGPRLYITAHGDAGPQGFAVLTFMQEPSGHTKAYLELVCSNARKGADVVRAVMSAAAGLDVDFVQLSAANHALVKYYQAKGFTREPNACMPMSRAQAADRRLDRQYIRTHDRWEGYIDKALDVPKRLHVNGGREGYLMSRCVARSSDGAWTLGKLVRGPKGTLHLSKTIRKYIPA